MRDVAVFRGEFGTILGFTNEINLILLLSLNIGLTLTIWSMLYFVICAFILMGLAGRYFRRKKIPEMNNTLQNELNSEMQTMIKDLKLIKERLGIK